MFQLLSLLVRACVIYIQLQVLRFLELSYNRRKNTLSLIIFLWLATLEWKYQFVTTNLKRA